MMKASGAARLFALCAVCLVVAFSLLAASPANAQMDPGYYSKSCPKLVEIVDKHVKEAKAKDSRMPASLLRLQFHDCFVQGCDASILLDDDARLPGGKGEKSAPPNLNSVRGFEVIDAIKAELEKTCPKTVSCADVITLASARSIQSVGLTAIQFPLGRKDSTTASFQGALDNLPAQSLGVAGLMEKFTKQGLNVVDLVALSGGHTLGFSRCVLFRVRLWDFNGEGISDPSIEPGLLATLKKVCPQTGNDDVLQQLDSSPVKFDNLYFKELMAFKGLLHSDEALFTEDATTKGLVMTYAKDQNKFFDDFKKSMIKMGNLGQNPGEIRLNCRKPNSFKFEDEEPLIELRSDI